MKPNYIYNAFLRRVIDGDTVKMDIDLGFGMLNRGRKGQGVNVRLYGIDCPDVRYGHSREAKDAATIFTRTWFEPPGSFVLQSMKWDGFGRAISRIWRDHDDTDLSTALLNAGHAVLYEKRTGRKSSK